MNPPMERLKKLGPLLKLWVTRDWEAKLVALDNARKPAPGEESKRPTLKRRTQTDDEVDEPEPTDEDRPTLKRRSPQTVS